MRNHKYKRLEDFLGKIPQHIYDTVLSFEQIEVIIIDKLPDSARIYPAWWKSHSHCKSWENGGFEIKEISLKLCYVVFKKVNQKTTPSG